MSRLSRRESELAALVGEDVELHVLRQYLRTHHSNVTEAANAFFDQRADNNTNSGSNNSSTFVALSDNKHTATATPTTQRRERD